MPNISLPSLVRRAIKSLARRGDDFAIMLNGLLNHLEAATLEGYKFTPKYNAIYAEDVRYIRADEGNDHNDGLTAETAWATLDKGLQWFAITAPNGSQVLDIAGDFVSPSQINLGGYNLGTNNTTLDVSRSGPNNWSSRAAYQIRAALDVKVADVTITSAVAATTSGLFKTVNVSNTLVNNAHVGQFLVGSGLFEYATIKSNGTGSLVLCTTVDPTTWTAPIMICGTGASITAGDPDDFDYATVLTAESDWLLSGITFKSNDDGKSTALNVNGPGEYVYIQNCDISGLALGEGTAYTSIDASYIHDFVFGINGMSYILRSSYMKAVEHILHGSGTYSDVLDCIFDSCTTPWGGGVTLSKFNFSMTGSELTGFSSSAVMCAFGKSRIADTVISSNSGDAVVVTDGGQAILNNVQGSLNTGVGCRISNGSQVQKLTGTAVAGTGGQIQVGGNASTTNWASTPATDLAAAAPQLCRVY